MKNLNDLLEKLASDNPLRFEELSINEIVYLSYLKCVLICSKEMQGYIEKMTKEELQELMGSGIATMTTKLIHKMACAVELDFVKQYEEEFKKHYNGYLN